MKNKPSTSERVSPRSEPLPCGRPGPVVSMEDEAHSGTVAEASVTRRHLRGSSLLLAGRFLALLLNFSAQILTVRYLTKVDYGAFAYALAVVTMATSVNLLGLGRAVSRFVPIYHERGDYDSMFGTVILAVGSIVGCGLALIVLAFGLEGALGARVASDPLAVGLLLVLIALAPLGALDRVFQGVVAALASPRAVFFRRYVLGPSLRLAAILIVLLVQGSVYLLATCYLVAGVLGVVIYVLILHRVLRERGLFQRFHLKSVRLPVREIFGFGVPLLTTDVSLILKTTMAVLILDHFRGAAEVADFRVVVPVAGLNLVVLQSFKILFMPAASRLYERKDTVGLNDLYWQSAIWITVVTFPIFAACFFLAEPLTTWLFGDRYATSHSPLVVLAIGSYFSAAAGLNTYALQVYARVRFITCINVLTTLVGLTLNLYLIPRYGVMGAAIATTAAVVLHNVLNHAGLLWRTDIDFLQWRCWRVYLTVLVAVLTLSLVSALLDRSAAAMAVPIMVVLVVLVSVAVVRINRHSLHLEETFPELARVPLLRRLFSMESR